MKKIIKLTESDLHRIVKRVISESKDWSESKEKLEKTFKFEDFNDSIDFVNKVAKIAEQQNHHPDITIKYDKVKITITDHEKGGVTEKCRKLVKSINEIEEPLKEEHNKIELTERCWRGYTQKGMKTMFGKKYPNCVKNKK
jgi:4a-hydroxytetrahydrobiopterin dehydratase